MNDSTLIRELAERGVRHLRVVEVAPTPPSLDTPSLVARLAAHSDPRLREALISLFIQHPEYAAFVPDVAASLEASANTALHHMYTAAVYLQRLWLGTLGIYLGHVSLLPNYFGAPPFQLPPANEHFGEAGLRALADVFRAKTGDDWLSVYHSAIQHLLNQLRLERQHGKQTN